MSALRRNLIGLCFLLLLMGGCFQPDQKSAVVSDAGQPSETDHGSVSQPTAKSQRSIDSKNQAQEVKDSRKSSSPKSDSGVRSQPNTKEQTCKSKNVQGTVEGTPLIGSKVKFKDTGGKQVYAIKPATGGAKLVDSGEKELARYTLKGQKIKIKDVNDRVIGIVKYESNRVRVCGADEASELWRLQKQSDGDWKLEKSQKLLYRFKKRDYGWEIESATDESLAKVKSKSGKISLRNPNGKTTIYTKGKIPLLAVAVSNCPKFSELELKLGAGLALIKVEEGKK